MTSQPIGVTQLFQRIEKIARQEFDPVAIVETQGAVGVRIMGDWQIDIMAYPCGCMVISSLRLFVPLERIYEALELVNLVNVLRVTGTLEIDFADYQLRLRHDLEAAPASINKSIVRSLIRYNVARSQNLIPKLQGFLDGKLSAQLAASISVPSSAVITGTSRLTNKSHPKLRLTMSPESNQN